MSPTGRIRIYRRAPAGTRGSPGRECAAIRSGIGRAAAQNGEIMVVRSRRPLRGSVALALAGGVDRAETAGGSAFLVVGVAFLAEQQRRGQRAEQGPRGGPFDGGHAGGRPGGAGLGEQLAELV